MTPMQARWIAIKRKCLAGTRSLKARREHAIQAPRAVALAYARDLRALVQEMWARALVRNDALDDDLHKRIVVVAKRAASRVSDKNRRDLHSLIGLSPDLPDPSKDLLDAFVRRNVDLITKLEDEAKQRIKNTITAMHGATSDDVADELERQGDVVGNKAKLIARDQTSKLNSALTQVRCQASGISEYIWVTSADERVRDTHRANDGKRFRFDSPPPETGNPGDDINCRCTASPVVDWLEEINA